MKRLHQPALAVVILVSSGCSAQTEVSDDGFVVIAEPQPTIMAAEVKGTLSMDEKGCLFVGEYFTIWPAGTVRTDNGVSLDNTMIAMGDQVTGGGGFLSRADAAALVSGDSVQDLENCAADGDTVAVLEVIN
ncbi:hypothetical protein LKO27_00905 [Tessaracoccus sp. OS52]|uniref:hypothetical protein n=1 Tax=Tessaracoccus sp. OS52 TaxID=2886691 RepID=UPI001D11984B|nr:hypothetical protein [Tessaracoccus sp. OS52]MCC2591990.1 hypothetical protein [Tessaracoccus sp. OS52]